MTRKEAIELAEKETKEKVVGGIEYKQCYVFNTNVSIVSATTCGFYLNKESGKCGWINYGDEVLDNEGKNLVDFSEMIDIFDDISTNPNKESKRRGKDMSKQGVTENLKNAASKAAKGTKAAINKTVEVSEETKRAIMRKMDVNGDGHVDSTDIILMAMQVKGVRISREQFLRKELSLKHTEDVVNKAIETTPAQAGITNEEVDRIADEVIKFERNAVSGISAALGVPGGVAMVATIPADIAQYYGYMLRAAQKLMYLYGFPELIESEGDVNLDTGTINSLTVCLAVMNGVAGANNFIKGMSKALAVGVEKKLLNAALTKGAIYPLVKNTAKWFGVKMTKDVFAGFFKKAIPVVGGVIGGGLTFATFKPCCYRLKYALMDTMLSNPENHVATEEENAVFEAIKKGVVIDLDADDIRPIEESDEEDELKEDEFEPISSWNHKED